MRLRTVPQMQNDAPKDKKAWFAIWCFVFVVALPLLVGLGKPVIFLFPVGAFALALFLYYESPDLYIGFVFWIFFLCPLIRRLIDYRSGYITPGPWGFTSVLVTTVSLISVFRYLPTAHKRGGLPFVLSLSAVGYACLVGITQNPMNAVVNGTLSWICPIAFSFHLFTRWRDYPQIKATLLKTFLWGTLAIGVYGVLQYVFAPPWEQFWLNAVDAGSFGKPIPFGIRVMSSSGSPQAFAGLMLVGLIVVFCEATNPISYVASGFGYITLILSMARAVWLSAAISIPLFLLSLKPSYQIRMIAVLLGIFMIVATALLSWDSVYDQFQARFTSFLNVEEDVSFNARTAGYQALWNIAVVQFLGRGIGFTTRGFETSIGANDSSLFPLIFTFGWLGLLFYMGGFLMILTKLMQIPEARTDIFIGACRMVALCVLFQSGFNSVFGGSIGLLMWSFSAMGLAGHKYYRAQKMSAGADVPFLIESG